MSQQQQQEAPSSPPSPSPSPSPTPPPAGPQGYAVELYFDPALENQVWNVLARRQISSHLISISSRPHITLFSSTSSSLPAKLLPLLRSLTSRSDPIPLALAAVGAFPSSSSLFLTPTPTSALLNFHAQLWYVVWVDLGDEFRVDEWVPNCLVADDVPRARMAEAFCILKDLKRWWRGAGEEGGVLMEEGCREVVEAEGFAEDEEDGGEGEVGGGGLEVLEEMEEGDGRGGFEVAAAVVVVEGDVERDGSDVEDEGFEEVEEEGWDWATADVFIFFIFSICC